MKRRMARFTLVVTVLVLACSELAAQTAFTVTYNGNGNSGGTVPMDRNAYAPGKTVTVLGNTGKLVRTNFRFEGWYAQTDAKKATIAAGSTFAMPKANVVLLAKWVSASAIAKPPTATPTAPATGIKPPAGSAPATPPIGTKPPPAATPTAPATGIKPPAGTAPTTTPPSGAPSNVHASAPTSFTVTFDGQGADRQASPAKKTVTGSATTIDAQPVPPSRRGYIFGGWYTARNGGGSAFTTSTPVTANITVYAKWDTYTYIVTYDSQGATIPASPASKTVSSPATNVGTLPAPPSRKDFQFDGWFPPLAKGSVRFTATTPVTADITVSAKWKPATYTVFFSSPSADTQASPAKKTVTVPATTIDALPTSPTRAGYTPGGWYTGLDGGGTAFTADTVVRADITVYAKWIPEYTVSFNSQDAGIPANPSTKTVSFPATNVGTLPTAPSRSLHTFEGWYTDMNGGGPAFTATTPVAANITVYAKWAPGYAIGDRGPAGGIVFYVKDGYSNDWRYLEAAPSDQSDNIFWFNGSKMATGADGLGVGTGKTNTTAIVNALGPGTYAAKVCADLRLGGYSGWFLPSRDELSLMYTNLKLAGLGYFSPEYYWSSSEGGVGAWVRSFENGNPASARGVPIPGVTNETGLHVRAIRAF
ncbi:MAG: InlB B-repeat-containing protein [Spirochaetes bacterium]|nr:InlB B-repeat-containing protein [Spirochaetota bacterium]